jgi:hypothetical protein
MPEDFDNTPLESSRNKAERKWRNHFIEKSFKEARAKANEEANKEVKPPEIASVIKAEKVKAGRVTRMHTRVANEIREIFNEHKRQHDRNVLLYLCALRAKKLKEARRLAAQRELDRDIIEARAKWEARKNG